MTKRSIPAGQFKAQCLALLDEVHDSRSEIVVTKRGKAVARVAPVQRVPRRSAFGRLAGTIRFHGDILSTGEAWEAGA